MNKASSLDIDYTRALSFFWWFVQCRQVNSRSSSPVRSRTPKPGRGEVLVDVKSAGMNFINTFRNSGVNPID